MKQAEFAVITAGGIGTRMASKIPKQFLLLDGMPVLMRTLSRFYEYSKETTIILVLPKESFSYWMELCKQHQFSVPHQVVEGGKSRFQSVKNGIMSIAEEDGLVAVHDGVRPLVSAEIINASFRLAAIHGSAVTAVRLKESIRITDQDTTKAVDRSRYRLIQTPQTFKLKLLRNSFMVEETPDMTDEASVAERSGIRISLFEGSYRNIKITTPEDMLVAEAFLRER